MSPLPLVSRREGSTVTMWDGRLCVYTLVGHTQRTYMRTQTQTDRHITQRNSCTTDMMMATCSHPCNPSRQRMVAIVCLSVCVHAFLSVLMSDFNLPAKLSFTHMWAWLNFIRQHSTSKRHIPSWPPSSLTLIRIFQTSCFFFSSPRSHCYRNVASRKSQKYLS